MERRKFIKQSLVFCGTSVFALSCVRRKQPTYVFLNPAEVICLMAFCEQIVPADTDPGAKKAVVVSFIDQQLVAHYSYHQDSYRNGLAALQQYCKKQHGKLFEELNFTKQHHFIKKMQMAEHPKGDWDGVDQSWLFGLIKGHTMQGFYSAPRHGGNKDYCSFKMMGIALKYG